MNKCFFVVAADMLPAGNSHPPGSQRLSVMHLLLLLLVSAALFQPAATSILVIQQHDDAAEFQIDDSPSHFGPRVSMTGLGGYLLLSEPMDGCGPLAPPPSLSGHHHWLLLVADGNCTSGQKVLHAQQAGYVAAIVFNMTGDGFSPMESDVKVKIPSFYIGLSNGIMLRANFLYGSGYSIYISGTFPYTFLAFIIPAMLLIVLCLLVLIAIMLYRCISEYRRTARRLLPKRMLAQIPTRRYTAAGSGPAGQDTCAICLEDYQEGDQLRVLPCRHAFHCQCVDPWLLRSRRVCPVCKRRLVSATVAVLVSESEDEQLLPVYRSQRPPPTRRSYGATLAAHGLPPNPSIVGGDEPSRVIARPRIERRPRRTRRRPEGQPATAPAPAPAADDVTAATVDVTITADDVRLLDDDHGADNTAAAPAADGDPETTVAPRGGTRPQLRPGQYTRLQEHTDDGAAVTAGPQAGTQSAGTETPPRPAPVDEQDQRSEAPPRPPAPGPDIV